MHRSPRLSTAAILTLFLVSISAHSHAIPQLGDVQDFEDGTAGFWTTGFMGATNPNPPTAVAPSNPGVNSSSFALSIESSGDPNGPAIQPGGRLNAFNASPVYAGDPMAMQRADYVAAGIGGVRLTLHNPGTEDLGIKVMVMSFNDDFSALQGLSFTTNAVMLGASETLTTTFAFDTSEMTDFAGDLSTTLTDVDSFRIFHNPVPGAGARIGGQNGAGDFAPFITASVEVDDIELIAPIPEPSGAALFALGLAALRWRGRHR